MKSQQLIKQALRKSRHQTPTETQNLNSKIPIAVKVSPDIDDREINKISEERKKKKSLNSLNQSSFLPLEIVYLHCHLQTFGHQVIKNKGPLV